MFFSLARVIEFLLFNFRYIQIKAKKLQRLKNCLCNISIKAERLIKAPLFSVPYFESRTVSEFIAECPTTNYFTANGKNFSNKNRRDICVNFSRLFYKYRLRVINNSVGMSVDSPTNTLNNALKTVREWCYYEAIWLACLRLFHALYNHRIKWVTHGRLLGVTIDNKLSRTQHFWSEETFLSTN